jgi:hypothetical protein
MIRPDRNPEVFKIEQPVKSVREIQKDLGVSVGTASKTQKVMKAQDPELNAALASKKVSLEQASELAQLPAPERKAALEAPKAEKPTKVLTDVSALKEGFQEPKPEKGAKGKLPACPGCKALREELDELISESRGNNEEFQAMIRICDADDKLAQMRKELNRSSAMNRVLQERLNGKMSECNALAADAKRWMKAAEKAGKQLEALNKDGTFEAKGR